jgi:tRNA A-37 threonylcarbamoyl transferase component Bud32
MAAVEINPRYRSLLEQHGLVQAERLLALAGEIISGHPDRHVARVLLGDGLAAIPAYLKREHHVPFKVRWLNAWAGFGFVSKSVREGRTLQALGRAGIGCPEWIAMGEDDQGRAFLLVREATGSVDLREYLYQQKTARAAERRRFARWLGAELARLHKAGFDHPDLYAKHLLIDSVAQTVCFLDCQRSRRRWWVTWQRRCRDLAALNATVAEGLATRRERLSCLVAYLRTVPGRVRLSPIALRIHRISKQLLCQRRIREVQKRPSPAVKQALLWQDGEALCLTPEFQAALAGNTPDWLLLARLPAQPRNLEIRTVVSVPLPHSALLLRRRTSSLVGRLWAWLRGRPVISPELRNAGLLFRLQRHGVPTARLLAFGQRQASMGRTESFLLTERVSAAVPLCRWLGTQGHRDRPYRHQVIREAGELLRRLHDAGCYLTGPLRRRVRQTPRSGLDTLQVNPRDLHPLVLLGSVEAIHVGRRPEARLAVHDLALLRQRLGDGLVSRTDLLRFLLCYLEVDQLTPAAKNLAWSISAVPCPRKQEILR